MNQFSRSYSYSKWTCLKYHSCDIYQELIILMKVDIILYSHDIPDLMVMLNIHEPQIGMTFYCEIGALILRPSMLLTSKCCRVNLTGSSLSYVIVNLPCVPSRFSIQVNGVWFRRLLFCATCIMPHAIQFWPFHSGIQYSRFNSNSRLQICLFKERKRKKWYFLAKFHVNVSMGKRFSKKESKKCDMTISERQDH